MPLTDDECQLVRSSLEAASTAELFAGSTRFYDALFARDPSLRALFRDDLEGQGMRFMSTLKTIVNALDSEEELVGKMAELARMHQILGIQPAQFDTMGEALMETFTQLLGDAFTPELDAAWRKAYGRISQAMLRSIAPT